MSNNVKHDTSNHLVNKASKTKILNKTGDSANKFNSAGINGLQTSQISRVHHTLSKPKDNVATPAMNSAAQMDSIIIKLNGAPVSTSKLNGKDNSVNLGSNKSSRLPSTNEAKDIHARIKLFSKAKYLSSEIKKSINIIMSRVESGRKQRNLEKTEKLKTLAASKKSIQTEIKNSRSNIQESKYELLNLLATGDGKKRLHKKNDKELVKLIATFNDYRRRNEELQTQIKEKEKIQATNLQNEIDLNRLINFNRLMMFETFEKCWETITNSDQKHWKDETKTKFNNILELEKYFTNKETTLELITNETNNLKNENDETFKMNHFEKLHSYMANNLYDFKNNELQSLNKLQGNERAIKNSIIKYVDTAMILQNKQADTPTYEQREAVIKDLFSIINNIDHALYPKPISESAKKDHDKLSFNQEMEQLSRNLFNDYQKYKNTRNECRKLKANYHAEVIRLTNQIKIAEAALPKGTSGLMTDMTSYHFGTGKTKMITDNSTQNVAEIKTDENTPESPNNIIHSNVVINNTKPEIKRLKEKLDACIQSEKEANEYYVFLKQNFYDSATEILNHSSGSEIKKTSKPLFKHLHEVANEHVNDIKNIRSNSKNELDEKLSILSNTIGKIGKVFNSYK